jgi:phosphomannomutase
MPETDSAIEAPQREDVFAVAVGKTTLGELAAAAGASFGTSGVRARIADLSPALCAAYTEAFLSIAQPHSCRLLIGHDLRPSSPAIAAVCRTAARERGIDVLYAGVLPTPALAFAAQSFGMPAIMITGSHIPFDRNGLKFYHAHGEITKADEQRILSTPVSQKLAATHDDLPDADPAPLDLYRQRYCSSFTPDALSGLRIGVYEHSSAARDLLHDVLRALGAETVSLGRCDDFVAIDTEAVRPEDREIAPLWARQHRLDAIVTTDGDADRPLVADESGVWLRGDVLGMICADELGAHTVVTPVTSNSGLEICGRFERILRTRVGSPHVIAAMDGVSDGLVVGYEANGGFLLGGETTMQRGSLAPLRTRDAVLPLLLVLSAMRRSSRRLSELLKGFGGRHTYSDRLQGIDVDLCKRLMDKAFSSPQAFAALLMGSPISQVKLDLTDGLRFTFAAGDIIHVRLSGNAPELRCYADAERPERAEQICRDSLDRLRPHVYRSL